MLYAIVGVLVLLVDQFTKYLTVANVTLNTYDGPNLLGLVGITYIRNYGAAFGLLENKRWILFILLVVFLLVMVFLFLKGIIRTPFSRWTAALLMAGALGNGIDRLLFGYVVDMVELLPGKVTLPIFNLADCLVTVGGILFCVSLILGLRNREEEEDFCEEPRPMRRRADPFTTPEAGTHDPFADGRVPRRTVRAEEAPVRTRRPAAEEAPVRTRRPAAAEGDAPATLEDLAPRRPAARPTAEPAEAPVRPRRPAPAPAESQPVRRRPVQAAAEEAPVRPRRPVTPAAPAEEAPARPRRTAPAAAEAPARRAPAAQPPAARPQAAKPAPKAADEFDLDSILAEFK